MGVHDHSAEFRATIRGDRNMRRAQVFETRPWLGCAPDSDPRVAAVPTMLAPEERRFYYWLTAHWMRGIGEAVDLGAFAGGSTARLAAGHQRARHPGAVHAFDRFTADPRVKRRVLYCAGVPVFKGNDILPLAVRLLKPWHGHVRLVRGDIADLGWHGAPIEVLTIDAFKNAALIDQMVGSFFPALIPGRSIVVQQDMLHWAQPWISALMQRFGDAFRPVAHVPATSIAFLLVRPLTPERLRSARIGGISDHDLLAAIEATRARLAGWGLGPAFDRMRAGLMHNPGVRIAWQMRRPDAPDRPQRRNSTSNAAAMARPSALRIPTKAQKAPVHDAPGIPARLTPIRPVRNPNGRNTTETSDNT